MKLRIWVVVLSFLMVLNLTAVVAFLFMRSHEPDDRGFRGQGRGRPFADRGPHCFESEERERLWTLIRDFRTDTRDLRSRAGELEEDIVEQLQRESVDRAAVDSLLKEVSAVRLEISERATDKLIEAKEFLSPRQQEMKQYLYSGGQGGIPAIYSCP